MPPQSIDPNVPAQIPADQLQDFKGFLDVVLDTVIGGAAPDVLTLGHQLWGGLAAIVVAWSGLKIAFSGTFEPWSLVRVVLAVAIPRTLLHYYSVPIPGVGFTFPAMVAAGGIWLQNLFISDVVSVGYTEMTALVQAFAARLGAAWSGGSLMTLVTEGVNVFFSSLVALMMGVPLVLGLVALFCLTYAQVIWAQVALRDRDPLGSRSSSPGCCSSRSRSCSGDGSARSWSTRSTASSPAPSLRVFMGGRHGLRHDLYRCLDGHRLLRPGRARGCGSSFSSRSSSPA